MDAVSGSRSPEGEDGEFEVTAEMLLHDELDDESTLQDEEVGQSQEEVEREVSDLQKEGDMPLEQLLAMYGYGAPVSSEGGEEEEEEGGEEEGKSDGLNCDEAEDVCVNVVVDAGESVLLSPESAETSQTGYSELLESAKTGQTSYYDPVDLTRDTQVQQQQPATKSLEAAQSNATLQAPPPPSDDDDDASIQPHLTSNTEVPLYNSTATQQHFATPSLPYHNATSNSSHSATDSALHNDSSHEHSLGYDVKNRPLHSAILNNAMLSFDGTAIVRPPSDGPYVREGVRVGRGGDQQYHPSLHQIQPGCSPSHQDLATTSNALLPHPQLLPAVEAPDSRETGVAGGGGGGGRGGGGGGGDREAAKPWMKPEYPERRSKRLMTSEMGRSSLETYLYFASLIEDGSDSDEEYCPDEPSWKKEIKVGAAYQAEIPACILPSGEDEASLPIEEGGSGGDTLLWSLRGTNEEQVVKFLDVAMQQVGGASNRNPDSDNEQALEVLHRCQHDSKLALEEIVESGLSKGMEHWTEEECRSFENGLRSVGKDFFQLKKQVSSRSVKEVVEFYYMWKKTERYDMFLQQYGKIGKKKIVCPPGHFSDFMERYFDAYDADTSDLHYGMTTVYSEVKREGTQHSN